VRTPRHPADDEIAAADAVAATRSGDLGTAVTWKHADTGAVAKMHDFWLVGNGVREALEITTIADERTRTNLGHWQKRGPGFATTFPGLNQAWTIMVDPTFNAKALKSGLADWLRALEADGITETGRWDSGRLYGHPVTNAMARAGVIIASAVAGPPAGMISLGYASATPSRPADDPNHVTNAVTNALTLPRHRADAEKLAASGLAVRHLYLWVDPLTRLDMIRALAQGTPTAAPAVDSRITDVWLGLPDESGVGVLRWSAAEGWRYAHVTV
jgi:hypothetical protein